jgi:hypothetical protein
MLDLLPRLVGPGGEVWLGDPGRLPAAEFIARAAERFELGERVDGVVTLHLLTRR